MNYRKDLGQQYKAYVDALATATFGIASNIAKKAGFGPIVVKQALLDALERSYREEGPCYSTTMGVLSTRLEIFDVGMNADDARRLLIEYRAQAEQCQMPRDMARRWRLGEYMSVLKEAWFPEEIIVIV